MGTKKINPPMVGVPVFFRWDCGPSSLTVWPNFNLVRKGIKTGPIASVRKKLTININTCADILRGKLLKFYLPPIKITWVINVYFIKPNKLYTSITQLSID